MKDTNIHRIIKQIREIKVYDLLQLNQYGIQLMYP